MFPHYPEIAVQYTHYQALIHEADEERLIQALSIVRRSKQLYDRALNWLGGRLARREKTLEECHDAVDCAELRFDRR